MARRTMRRHVIVSQGGKTGRGGTFLRDQTISEEQAQHIPDRLIEVVREPGTPAPAPKPEPPPERPSVPPPMEPTPEQMVPPGSVRALRRWSAPKMVKLAEQEGIQVKGLDKNGLRALLAAHFGLK